MRFALLGDHPDGLDMARALVDSGRHELAAYSGPAVGAEYLRRWNFAVQPIGDLEEVLADPAVDAIIVAGRPGQRPDQLRRALQSERHVLCVQPVDATPDTAYEAALIQGDTRQVLLPLMPEALHPGMQRLAELARSPASVLGTLRLVEIERWSPDALPIEAGGRKRKPALPGWDVLRVIGGEIAEVLALAPQEAVDPHEPLLLSGRFERGGLFQAALLSGQHEAHWRLSVVGSYGQADLLFPQGWPGPARLTWRDEAGELCEETWVAWNPWPALVEVFEEAVAGERQKSKPKVPDNALKATRESIQAAIPPERRVLASRPRLAWQDAVRSLELDDAARRSVEKRRASALEYQEATEEAGFKGTMTLVGCGLVWGSIVLLILSRWLPWAGWLIAPLFGLFLIMQMLRWVAQRPSRPESEGSTPDVPEDLQPSMSGRGNSSPDDEPPIGS
jgi:predicted dehydrogenase